MIKYESFRANNDEDLVACLNTMVEYSPNFTVISINQVHGSWVVFYTRLVSPEVTTQDLLDTFHKRQPPDRSWVESVPVKDAHKEVRVTYDNGPLPDVPQTDSYSKWWRR